MSILGFKSKTPTGYGRIIINNNNTVEKIILSGQTHNTIIMRKGMSGGKDPAEVIANVVKNNIY